MNATPSPKWTIENATLCMKQYTKRAAELFAAGDDRSAECNVREAEYCRQKLECLRESPEHTRP